ncbi:alanine--tRNA ligase-like [Chenopodium quinoa]|uniref:alanine--tRNA ligase-like n=1 Tax=Chenopodium quinoa TaxID=63459 RepID=UPI000B797763|nr:alanine--tRNA ligase-like [Chenopodium quinoa]
MRGYARRGFSFFISHFTQRPVIVSIPSTPLHFTPFSHFRFWVSGKTRFLSEKTRFSSSSLQVMGLQSESVDGVSLEWPAKKVRDTFIKYFEGKNHAFWKSSPVVPVNDPTLLFANAGMNQFKPIFLGNVDPNSPLSELKRACNTQKCIRAGGKHNDLDDVGKDTYHHTFFEMLGNWSFGDYFKKEAIQWAWELLTKVYGLPANQIYATYFGGDEKAGLVADTEAKEIWLNYLPPERVLPFGCKDNFWEMGDTGPCGPCTEIHFDRIGNRDAASLVNNDDPTCIEIWNLVFIQFNRETDGSLKSLPAKHVDTGMGFERLTSILQNKMSNYDTDVFMPLFDAIQQATGARTYSGKVGDDDVDKVDMAYRVVADHIRTLSFAIADGACPGNEGREYVLRRILRRAVRYGNEVLNAKEGFFNGLVPTLVNLMDDIFPELKQHEKHIKDVIAAEETSFGKTLLKGIEKFKKAAQEVDGKTLTGQDAFLLWDSYGFPLDLTQLMAEERGLTVDTKGFIDAMAEARERSRSAQNKQAGGAITMDANAMALLYNNQVPTTDDSSKYIWFKDHDSTIRAVYTGSEFLESAEAGQEIGVVLESTSFYAEQGGQIFDTGSIDGPHGSFKVSNVQAFGGFVLHIGSSETGRLSVGDKVTCKVDYNRRQLIAPNHTCTHMLNFALREVLGTHVDQKGSIVLPEKLRYDFSHGKPVQSEELRKIESIVNEQIKAELDVYAKEAKLTDAKRVNGLRAVFGEIYPDPVRIVSIGKKVEDLLADPEKEEWSQYSAELCGGTHISNTKEAKAFALLSEEGIAKGIRRVTAVTSDIALEAFKSACSLEQEVIDASNIEASLLEKKVAALRSSVDAASIPTAKKSDIRLKISLLQDQVRNAQKRLAAENRQKVVEIASERAEAAVAEGKTFCISRVDVGVDASAVKILKEAIQEVIQEKKIPIMVFSVDESANKAIVYAGVPGKDNKCEGLEVSEWLTVALGPLKGKGGKGKGGLAQGQGTDASNVEEAIKLAVNFASMKLNC